MKQIYLIPLFVLILVSGAMAQALQDVNIHYMLRGSIIASSSIVDKKALGGFAKYGAIPQKIGDSLNLNGKGIILKIDTKRASVIENAYHGYTLFLANKTDTILPFYASDSRLKIIAEVYYKGKWSPIEYLPSSGCGNSYHTVYLNPNEYWQFKIPKFTGDIKTKLRYTLLWDVDTKIHSNTIGTRINKDQLTKKLNSPSRSIMDPYNF